MTTTSETQSTGKKPATANDELLRFCDNRVPGDSDTFILFLTILSCGIFLPFWGLIYVAQRMTPLTEGQVFDLMHLLKSEDELAIGRRIYAKRNGIIYPKDLVELRKHLLDQAENARKQSCLTKLSMAV